MHTSQASNAPAQHRHHGAQRVRRWSVVCTVLPFAYAFLGLLALGAPQFEVFPFFSWFLFPVTPSTVTRWAVRVERVNGHALTISTWYQDEQSFGSTRHSMDAQVLIQALGEAVRLKQHAKAAQIRGTFEGNFLQAPCRYSLFEHSYDPLERWAKRGREQQPTKPAAVFECGQP